MGLEARVKARTVCVCVGGEGGESRSMCEGPRVRGLSQLALAELSS